MCCQKEPYILVFGVSVYDIIGFSYQKYREKDSNPGRVKVSFGGVCRNIAENLARLNVNTKFISMLGDDNKADRILEHAKQIHLDMSDSYVVKGVSTPTYMAILDEHGEMQSAIVDMQVTEYMTEEFIDSKADLISNAEYMILDTDNPSIDEYILKTFQGKTRFILDPVSAARVAKVKHLIPYFHTIKPNRQEAEVLCGFELRSIPEIRKAGQHFLDLGVSHVMISLDCDGIYYNDGKQEGIIKTKQVPVVNVTGAGDSCVAGIGYGYMTNQDIRSTVKYAIAMSVITIAHEETIHPGMCNEMVEQYLGQLEWEETIFS